MPFGNPVIWTNSQEHNPDDCFACVKEIVGLNRAKKRKVELGGTRFVQLPLPHSESIPIPKRPSPTEEYIPSTFDTIGETSPSFYVPSNVSPQCNHAEFSQKDLDKIIRRLKLSQRQSVILTQELKKNNVLAPDVKVYGAIGRHRQFTVLFKSIEDNPFAYCTDIKELVLKCIMSINQKTGVFSSIRPKVVSRRFCFMSQTQKTVSRLSSAQKRQKITNH
ncbi:hypothetical protein HHI36_017658 [Cryptolaemus montrouzieri]|uniref:Uncharacterized protein n=1 Tax=Cryptolaemus montrouzieri TaxID=559131 RepID=A0ABD2NN61_9CUCU